MPKVKNVSGEDRTVPWLNNRLILAGGVAEVPDEDLSAYTCQPRIWQAVEEEKPAAKAAAPKEE